MAVSERDNNRISLFSKITICIILLLINATLLFSLEPYVAFKTRIVLFATLSVIGCVTYYKSKILDRFHPVYFIISILFSLFLGYKTMRTVMWNNVDAGKICEYFVFIAAALAFLYIWYAVIYIACDLKSVIVSNLKTLMPSITVSLYVSWFFFLFLPLVTMLGNPDDYLCAFLHLLIPEVILFFAISLVLIAILAFIKATIRQFFEIVFIYLSIMTYAQYMFMNSHMPSINGSVFDAVYYQKETIINAIVWFVFLIVIILLAYNKKTKVTFEKAKRYIPPFLFAIQFVALVSALLTAPSSVYRLKNYLVDTTKQYNISSNENILIFVFDAVDNEYLKTLVDEEPKIFDQMHDFTMYTNTCSVYDATNSSLPQMFSGGGFECQIADYNEFYDRLHENNYVINFYNYEYAEDNNIDIEKYFDNYQIIDSNDIFSAYKISYKDIAMNSMRLSAYQILPYALKNQINALRIDFKNVISHADGSTAIEDNIEFYENMNYTVDESDKNYLVIQHLMGAHIPIEAMDGTRQSVDVINKTIEQLKENGLYDSTTIIFTSDHGFQDETIPGAYPTASTPAFIIKSAGETHEEMQFNSAPIYHTDLLSTILVCADLYEEDDEKYFGTSIFDWHEGDLRERTWANTGGSDKYCVYTFTGTTEDLVDAVNNGDGVRYK